MLLTLLESWTDIEYNALTNIYCTDYLTKVSDLISSIRRSLNSKLIGPGVKPWPGTMGGLVTIIMWYAWPG